MKQGTQSQCSGTTQGEGGGRQVHDGGTHGHPWLIHVDVWQKTPQYCKVIILQLKLINKLKKKKESACNVVDLGLIPELGRSPGRGHGNPFQYYCLENPHRQRSLVGYSPWGHTEVGHD